VQQQQIDFSFHLNMDDFQIIIVLIFITSMCRIDHLYIGIRN
jgi:hypothetical protein